MTIRYCSCFFDWHFPPLDTTWVEAVEGETIVTTTIE